MALTQKTNMFGLAVNCERNFPARMATCTSEVTTVSTIRAVVKSLINAAQQKLLLQSATPITRLQYLRLPLAPLAPRNPHRPRIRIRLEPTWYVFRVVIAI
jgi:hypothetical protein